MSFSRPTIDLLAPPSDFDAAIDWFERVSYHLVLLEEYPLPDVRRAIDAFDRAVRDHLRTFSARLAPEGPSPAPPSDAVSTLRSDHAWFRISLDQLEWSYRIVEGEDHGGHRQALGQYGRVFAEALRRHRKDEVNYLTPTSGSAMLPPFDTPPKKP
ncbi:MAG: hypothetical protein WBF81_05255 [Thermoplasmata archaeon]